MLVRLVILWLLSEQAHHGYRIKKILQDASLRFWFRIEDASIYSMLRTLVKSGYARRVATEREGRRPTRTRYAITPRGRRHYQELLRHAWRDPVSPTDPVQVCLAAGGDLDETELATLPRERLEAVERRLALLDAQRRSAPSAAMVDRERARVAGELGWLRTYVARGAFSAIGEPSASGIGVEKPNTQEGEVAVSDKTPQIDLICNVVIRNDDGKVLLARYGEDERWWLPYRDLVPYEHPDEVAPKVLEDLGGLAAGRVAFSEIESFRGRTGWHVMFNYLANASGEPSGKVVCQWFAPDQLPAMAHGSWEKSVIRKALEKA